MAVPLATSQEKQDDQHGGVQVQLEALTLRDGLPVAGFAEIFSVGRSIKIVYFATIEAQSRWLPGNTIELTLEITEIDGKRVERVLLEGFEPKTLVLREDAASGTELLRLIPLAGLEPCFLPAG